MSSARGEGGVEGGRNRFFRRRPARPRSRWQWLLVGPLLFVAGLSFAPEALAWPYSAQFGATTVYSEAPIPPQMVQVLARSDALLARSELHGGPLQRRLFLSSGGWRWRLLALTSSGSFALRRPFRSGLVFNRSDVAADRVENGRKLGGDRTLSGTIAHETTHILIARRYGELQAAMVPSWKAEGYADFVAQESSLSPEEARIAERTEKDHPALEYYRAREKVAAALARGGGVDGLFLRAR
ncbi:MAG TPA: hypothetical protein VF727_00375 [Allosphingosinicella sp.]|jgi:hypothetical protein